MISELKDRLRLALSEKGLTQADFVRKLNHEKKGTISQAAVSKWLNGKTPFIRSDLVIKAADILGVRPEWLNNGIEPMHYLPSTSNVTEGIEHQTKKRRIPVISFVHAGVHNSADFITDEFIEADEETSELTYALRVVGDSMEPLFHNGDLILVDPSVTPKPGDYVIARILNEDESTFKKLRFKGIDENGQPIMELVPLNPDYPVYTSNKTPFVLCGKVIEHRTYFKTRW